MHGEHLTSYERSHHTWTGPHDYGLREWCIFSALASLPLKSVAAAHLQCKKSPSTEGGAYVRPEVRRRDAYKQMVVVHVGPLICARDVAPEIIISFRPIRPQVRLREEEYVIMGRGESFQLRFYVVAKTMITLAEFCGKVAEIT